MSKCKSDLERIRLKLFEIEELKILDKHSSYYAPDDLNDVLSQIDDYHSDILDKIGEILEEVDKEVL